MTLSPHSNLVIVKQHLNSPEEWFQKFFLESERLTRLRRPPIQIQLVYVTTKPLSSSCCLSTLSLGLASQFYSLAWLWSVALIH